ncbi:Imm63 family immunity protein [Mycobacterium paraintracellulare]|uniref:Imm63 family immunity protein n=1 Tax=Mycobacterium paraintracellulare TaxID=1138383 RepID=UPI001916B5B3|nr:Imm63 family immunity protein [Mycobacterium paraintracellulare]
MVDDKTAHLQSEVNRIAALLNARPIQAGVVLKDDDRNVYIDDDGRYHYDYWERGRQRVDHVGDIDEALYIDDDGRYHYDYWERGRQRVDHVGDIDEALYWFACDIAFDIGGSYAARHRPRDQDPRILMWAKQYEVLNRVNPDWAARCVRETAELLRRWGKHDDVALLPNIPGRDG